MIANVFTPVLGNVTDPVSAPESNSKVPAELYKP